MPKAKAPKASKATTTAVPAPVHTPPNWPIFKPQLPVVDLALETVVEDKVVVYRNFWPSSLCREYVSFLKTLPLSTTPPGKPKDKDMAARHNDRFQINDPGFAKRLWTETGLRNAVLDESVVDSWGGTVLGLSPNIRIYRYSKGQYFDCHYDDTNYIPMTLEDGKQVSGKTTWTLLLYLTSAAEGCRGGETVFYHNDLRHFSDCVEVKPETGMLLLHKHGKDCMLHEALEVVSGEKWVIRTDLCVDPTAARR